MNDKRSDHEAFRTFQLMSQIENGQTVSQRELANRLGIAVGLVNSYLKNLVAKGYVRVKSYPRNRYAYLLTPSGFAEKSRLACHHLSYFTSLYTTTRQSYLTLFRNLASQGIAEVVFVGVDEVAEIAYLSLLELNMCLSGIYEEGSSDTFFDHKVMPLGQIIKVRQVIVITSLKRRNLLLSKLIELGVDQDAIHTVD